MSLLFLCHSLSRQKISSGSTYSLLSLPKWFLLSHLVSFLSFPPFFFLFNLPHSFLSSFFLSLSLSSWSFRPSSSDDHMRYLLDLPDSRMIHKKKESQELWLCDAPGCLKEFDEIHFWFLPIINILMFSYGWILISWRYLQHFDLYIKNLWPLSFSLLSNILSLLVEYVQYLNHSSWRASSFLHDCTIFTNLWASQFPNFYFYTVNMLSSGS